MNASKSVSTAGDFIRRRRSKGLQPRNGLAIRESTQPRRDSARALRLEREINLIIASSEITYDEYFRLKKKRKRGFGLTRKENQSMRRLETGHFYGSVSKEILTFDDNGRGEIKISRLELMHHVPFEVNRGQNFSHPIFENDDDLEIVRVRFFQSAFAKAGIFDVVEGVFNLDAEYSDSTLDEFVNFMEDEKEAMVQLFKKKINRHLHKKPALQVWTLLIMVGLDTVSPTTSKGYEVFYKINPDQYSLAMEIVHERERLIWDENEKNTPWAIK